MESVALEMKTVTGVGIGERATIGRLRVAETGALANGSEIAVCCERIGRERIVELFEGDFSAIVCVGDAEEGLIEAARERGIPMLFVSEENIGICICGENAVLYPHRGVMFISPTVEIIDAFMRDGEGNDFLGDGIEVGHMYEISSGKCVGRAIEVSNIIYREDELFDIYCRLTEDRSGELCVCLRRSENTVEHLRALMRAAVYGSISLAVLARTPHEFRNIRGLVDAVREELASEGREFNRSVRVGVIAEDIFGALYASELSEMADFFAVSPLETDMGVPSENSYDACERYISLLRQMLSPVYSGLIRIIRK